MQLLVRKNNSIYRLPTHVGGRLSQAPTSRVPLFNKVSAADGRNCHAARPFNVLYEIAHNIYWGLLAACEL